MVKNEGEYRLMSMSLMSIYDIMDILFDQIFQVIQAGMIPELEVKGPLKWSRFHHPKQFTKNVYMDLPRALVLSGEDVWLFLANQNPQ